MNMTKTYEFKMDLYVLFSYWRENFLSELPFKGKPKPVNAFVFHRALRAREVEYVVDRELKFSVSGIQGPNDANDLWASFREYLTTNKDLFEVAYENQDEKVVIYKVMPGPDTSDILGENS